jgi:hypothetical protein
MSCHGMTIHDEYKGTWDSIFACFKEITVHSPAETEKTTKTFTRYSRFYPQHSNRGPSCKYELYLDVWCVSRVFGCQRQWCHLLRRSCCKLRHSFILFRLMSYVSTVTTEWVSLQLTAPAKTPARDLKAQVWSILNKVSKSDFTRSCNTCLPSCSSRM